MNNEILQRYQVDAALFNTKRDASWGEKYRQEVQLSVNNAITTLGLDEPWEKIHADPMKEAVADALFGSILSSYGPKISVERQFELDEIRFKGSLHNVAESDPNFTSNHRSVSVRLRSLDSYGNPIIGPVFSYHMPTFATREDNIPTLGDLSPISISQDGIFQLYLPTPSGHVWYKLLEMTQASESANQVVGEKGGTVVFARDIASPCVSKYQVMVLRDTCERKSADCAMCTVPRGTGLITPERKKEISNTLGLLIDEAVIKGDNFFYQTLSGGSTNTPDGGFSTGHEMALRLIEEKLRKYDNKIKAKLELEMMLPPVKDMWIPVIDKLNHYVRDLGWEISLAINMEALPDKWRGLFIPGTKGTLTVADHIEFAKVLREKTGGKIQMSTLVMFGMKPVEMDYATYMLDNLKITRKLIAAGIHPDYAPCKNDLGTKYEAYPPLDPVFYMIQYLALKKVVNDAKLPPSHGCVGSCSRCHQTEATSAMLAVAKRHNISLPEIFEPILADLGPEFQKKFSEIFTYPSLPH